MLGKQIFDMEPKSGLLKFATFIHAQSVSSERFFKVPRFLKWEKSLLLFYGFLLADIVLRIKRILKYTAVMRLP
jgi:hypothetical protein